MNKVRETSRTVPLGSGPVRDEAAIGAWQHGGQPVDVDEFAKACGGGTRPEVLRAARMYGFELTRGGDGDGEVMFTYVGGPATVELPAPAEDWTAMPDRIAGSRAMVAEQRDELGSEVADEVEKMLASGKVDPTHSRAMLVAAAYQRVADRYTYPEERHTPQWRRLMHA